MNILSAMFGSGPAAEISVGSLVFLFIYLTGFVSFQKWSRIAGPRRLFIDTSFPVSAPHSRPWLLHFGFYAANWQKEAGDEPDKLLPAEACCLAAPPERHQP